MPINLLSGFGLMGSGLQNKPNKVSWTNPNVANIIAEHLSSKWPDVVQYCYSHDGIWFSGSQVWSFLYPTIPYAVHASDTDIFTVGSGKDTAKEIRDQLIIDMGWDKYPITHTKAFVTGGHYKNGKKITTPNGIVDVWWNDGEPKDALMLYPEDSHAHCRAAYSFTEGLLVLPNTKGWS